MEEFSVKAVTKLAGINANTLRAWERRYNALEPKRGGTGRRIYTLAEAERLRLLVQLVKRGHAIGQIATSSTPELQALLEQTFDQYFDLSGYASRPTYQQTDKDIEIYLEQIEDRLTRFDLAEIHRVLARSRVHLSAKSFALQLAVPLLRRIAELLLRGKLSVALEHALSAILRIQLGDMIYPLRDTQLARATSLPNHTACIATQEGDSNEFGILIAALLAAANSLPVHYFGINLPATALAEGSNALRSNIVIVGNSSLTSPGVSSPIDLTHYLEDLDDKLHGASEIWLCGLNNVKEHRINPKRTIRRFDSLVDLDRHIVALCG